MPGGDRTPVIAWGRVCAFAWTRNDVLNNLRKDPKKTIEEIANGGYDADPETVNQAQIIVELSENPGEDYQGYLPIPKPFGGLNTLTKEQLQELLQKGVTGAFRFDQVPDLWADALSQAWNDENLLKEIRRNPLEKLPNAEQLKNSRYGIFPMPDRPKGLEDLELENLYKLLSDDVNVPYLGGIFPPGL